jgi:hypothetical protein
MLPRVGLVRVLRTWGVYPDPHQADLEGAEGRGEPVQWLGWSMYLLLAAAAVAALPRTRAHPPVRLLLAALALQVAFVALIAYGNQRFRIIIEPLIVILAADTLVHAVRWHRSSRAGADALSLLERTTATPTTSQTGSTGSPA